MYCEVSVSQCNIYQLSLIQSHYTETEIPPKLVVSWHKLLCTEQAATINPLQKKANPLFSDITRITGNLDYCNDSLTTRSQPTFPPTDSKCLENRA